MGWLRKRREPPPQDVAERLTGTFRVTTERVPLSDTGTVRRWLEELDPFDGHQVHVRRSWGVVAAVADHRHWAGVVLSDAEGRSWGAYPPDGGDDDLTPEQVRHVMLDALQSADRPAWPQWRRLD